MPALVSGIHVLLHSLGDKDVAGRDEPGHDERLEKTHPLLPATPFRPGFDIITCPNRGRRESRAASATRSSACKQKSTQTSPPQVRRIGPAFPARMVLTASFALSLVIGFVATIPAQCKALSRVDASVEASRPHDFAVRSSARSSCAPTASIASRTQRLVTTAKRPS